MSRDFFFQLGAWARWGWKAKSWRLTHPPHLFAWFEAVRRPMRQEDLESLRRAFERDSTPLTAPDAGAGSRVRGARTVGKVARTALKSARQAGRLARLAEAVGAERVLELGTCLGVTTAYLARTGAHVTTLEADPVLAAAARSGWERTGCAGRIEGHVGTFADLLPNLMATWRAEGHPGFDLVFIDGHHHGPALREYVELLRPWLRRGDRPTALVCDDIRWSPSMWHAWETLSSEWTVAVDCGSSGWLVEGSRLTPFRRAVRLG